MAVKKCTIANSPGAQDRTALLVTWTGVTETDTFAPVSLPEYTNKSFQLTGTIGGATTVLKGSNDGTNYAGLQDAEGAAISMGAAGLVQVLENTQWYLPEASGGTGQSLTVTMLFVRSTPPR